MFEPLVKEEEVEEDKDRASWSIFNKGEELAPIDKYIFPSLEIKPDNNSLTHRWWIIRKE